MRKTVLLALVLAVAACGKGKDGSGSGGGGNSEDDAWGAKPLKTTTGTVSGVKFSVDLPDGLKIDKTGPAGDLSVEWIAADADEFSSPTVTVGFDALPAKTLDALADERSEHGKYNVPRKEAAGTTFKVTIATKKSGMIRATVLTATPDGKAVECTASWAHNDGFADDAKARAFLEKVCDTLKLL